MSRPKIILSISDRDIRALKDRRILKGIDLIEARIDTFKRIDAEYVIDALKHLRRYKYRLPVIGTIRKKSEGGSFVLGEQERFRLFHTIIPLVDIVDIELSSNANPAWRGLIKRAYILKKKIIISYHNLNTTPSNRVLERIVLKAEEEGADIVKVACFARWLDDVRRLLGLTLKYACNLQLVSVSLGRIGAVSRLAFPLAGSLFTYGYIGKSFATGQIHIDTLKKEVEKYYFK